MNNGADSGRSHAGGTPPHIPERCRALVRRRHFVDREPGAILMWLPADDATRADVATLVPRAQAWHPSVHFAVHQSGAAIAVKASAREADLDRIYATYFVEPPTGD
jgi:hypothetical protein